MLVFFYFLAMVAIFMAIVIPAMLLVAILIGRNESHTIDADERTVPNYGLPNDAE